MYLYSISQQAAPQYAEFRSKLIPFFFKFNYYYLFLFWFSLFYDVTLKSWNMFRAKARNRHSVAYKDESICLHDSGWEKACQ